MEQVDRLSCKSTRRTKAAKQVTETGCKTCKHSYKPLMLCIFEDALRKPCNCEHEATHSNQTSDMVSKRPTSDFAKRPENQKPNVKQNTLLRLNAKAVFLKELPLRNLLHPRKVNSGVIDVM